MVSHQPRLTPPPATVGVDFDINEHLCLAAARRAGLIAATTSIHTFGAERALVVERYDRIIDDSGAVVRVHQEDLCQVLSVHPDRKYEVDGGPGAEQLGGLIREVAGYRDVARGSSTPLYSTGSCWPQRSARGAPSRKGVRVRTAPRGTHSAGELTPPQP